jgi:hypothetical protein
MLLSSLLALLLFLVLLSLLLLLLTPGALLKLQNSKKLSLTADK